MEVILNTFFADTILTLAASSPLNSIMNGLSVVLGLGMVIFFHELGHFAVAKWCDVHVERFSIGIGPIIWSRQKGETEYALSALPFGGYVKMLGQDDMDPNQMTSDEIAENPRSYSAKKVWQRMAIISAGVIMNVITGFMFFAIAYRMGVVELTAMVGNVIPGSPAWEAGIRDGDMITSINGDDIENFNEINQAIVLSSGAVNVQGTHADGEPLDVTITPKRGKTVRMIGVGPAATTLISSHIDDPAKIVMPGMPSEKASQAFLPGDRITAVNGEPVSHLHDMATLTAGFASEDIVYSVERSEKSESQESTSTSTVEITVPPRKMKSIGLWMSLGPITSIISGSAAETQGLMVGDQIIKVGELTVSQDIDPLRLPNYFAERAGEEVAVTVNRPKEGDSNETVTINITPTDAPGWSERPSSITAPLPISAIGAGIRILPRIRHIVPESEAARSGKKFAEGQKITKVELLHSDPANISPDIMGDTAVATINLELADEEDETPGKPNWAYVFDVIQSVPGRQVRLYVSNSADTTGDFSYLFEDHEEVDDWFVPLRGITGWEQESRLRKAESFSEAIALGIRYTKNSGINIYMTLRSLFERNLSPRALSGPLGIVRIGYMVADDGWSKLLMFLGFLSINLAVLNFLPIPVLDGGHMLFLIGEAITRKKPSPRLIGFAHGIGLIFIISLFVFVMYLDIFVNGINAK